MEKITIETTINAPIEKAWQYWNEPAYITQWCFASTDWHCPTAANDLKVGGKLQTRMEAKDGSFGFDFEGVYEEVKELQFIKYGLADGRKVSIDFLANGEQTKIVETFDPESENPIEMQRAGWQAILDNYKRLVEG